MPYCFALSNIFSIVQESSSILIGSSDLRRAASSTRATTLRLDGTPSYQLTSPRLPPDSTPSFNQPNLSVSTFNHSEGQTSPHHFAVSPFRRLAARRPFATSKHSPRPRLAAILPPCNRLAFAATAT